jgi:cysteine desulfurase / selenocysteine lyase
VASVPLADTADQRAQIVGTDVQVPLLDGSLQRPINFDNAASTPALRPVLETVNRFMEW